MAWSTTEAAWRILRQGLHKSPDEHKSKSPVSSAQLPIVEEMLNSKCCVFNSIITFAGNGDVAVKQIV